MRRKHCEITDQAEMAAILNETTVGRMATTGHDGYPYIVPVNFVFSKGNIYFHCAHKGEKLDNIARDPRVCFEADVPLAYLEVAFNGQNKACHVHQLYRSVIIRGRAAVVSDPAAKVEALTALAARHEGNHDFEALTPDDPPVKGCSVVEIIPENMTGKADLIQNKSVDDKRPVAADLAGRGLPGDLEAVKAMGFELEGDAENGWRLKD